ncbi:MAG: hypothetical protein A3C02_00150 [Candidatus Andersenbacteria bacterium RIFCSPHIGHO2_02_FULL_45_11]|nr:MAG: hypothetical protein A2805_00235 [Candidatus Andersenbacteria bacterium RIFCSPHIGHO2_01_FULL_46_36]OGY31967.1 MAG: hypothetical protein A3C02_00150 [Candidatus Andersenbacteria bacterium RIFCSPHIGHO2_02_FULL_45_11]
MWIAFFGACVYLMGTKPTGGWWLLFQLLNWLFMLLCIFMLADSLHKIGVENRKLRDAFIRKVLTGIGIQEAEKTLSYENCEKLFGIVTDDLLYQEREVMLAFYGKYNGDTVKVYTMAHELGMELVEMQELLLIVFDKMSKQFATYTEFVHSGR